MLFFITVVFPVLVFFSLIYCFLSTVTMTSTKVSDGSDYNFINALTDVFYYKKSLLSYIICYAVISKAFNIFGTNGGVLSLIIILLIYFKILKIPLFSNPELNLSTFGELSDYDIAEKSCGGLSTINIDTLSKINKLKKDSFKKTLELTKVNPEKINSDKSLPEIEPKLPEIEPKLPEIEPKLQEIEPNIIKQPVP